MGRGSGVAAAAAVLLLLLTAAVPSCSEEGRERESGVRQILRFPIEPLAGPYARGQEFASAQEEYCRAHGFERTTEGEREGAVSVKRVTDVRLQEEEESSSESTVGNWEAQDINHELKSEIATHLEAYEGGRLFGLTMGIGTPLRAFSMLVDTTSRQFVVPSAELCADAGLGASCSNTSTSYRASLSASCDPLPCSNSACEQCIDGYEYGSYHSTLALCGRERLRDREIAKRERVR